MPNAVDTMLLGHSDYAVALAADGSGSSRWRGLDVTRWRSRPQSGPWGTFVYVSDASRATCWSATASPLGGRGQAWMDGGCARYARSLAGITTTLEVAVAPDAAVEVRGLGLCNTGACVRDLEITSYAELVLGDARADAAHPAFSKMFIVTECVDGVLLAHRRKRDANEPDVWAAHALVVDSAAAGASEWETDRLQFIGRDRDLARPAALDAGAHLSGTTGTVLDPIFSLRARLRVAAGATVRAAFITVAAASSEAALALVARYGSVAACADVFHRVAQSGTAVDAVPNALTGALLRGGSAFAPARERVMRASGGAPVLWAKGISGDLPIATLTLDAASQLPAVRTLLAAQRYWRSHQLPVDVVLVIARGAAGAATLDSTLKSEVGEFDPAPDKAHGSIFVLRGEDVDDRLDAGLAAAANIAIDARDARQVAGLMASAARGPIAVNSPSRSPLPPTGGRPAGTPTPEQLTFWNGTGGFSRDGKAYVVVLPGGASTPMPWAHVVANPGFGFLVTATGGGYAWAGNGQQNQITPWSNDAVEDPPGEAFLLRDLDDSTEWSATASPLRADGATYVARFGPGYARFDASVHGIETELLQCAASENPVKLSRLRITSNSRRPRRISVSQHVTWSLGPIGGAPARTTAVTCDARLGAVFAHNGWRDEHADAVAFAACAASATCASDAATATSSLGHVVELAPGASTELVFLLGEGADRAAAERLVQHYQQADFEAALTATDELWEGVLGALQVATPEPSIDLLVNRCLPYQVLACRLWARTAFYQASGAFGFRDQLQDVAALCIARPDLARAHILLSASRQFEEGDAQHWWLPPSGKGVRTRIVDDRLWLPYVVAHYVTTTGDAAILDAQVPFVHGDALQPGQTDAFYAPAVSAQTGSLFEHCARAIEVSLGTGAHGLPLMGTGDWNDGLNRVGAGGTGESAWMGWFLGKVIADFAPFAEARGDARAIGWREHVKALQLALETKAWDGAWYRRAFYDDGTPLGSSANAECRIESMAQSWAVISGMGDPARAKQAMQAVAAHLVRNDDGLVALFDPPFDHTTHDPGYIKGYPPGLRENGGQYTHGSIWSLIAFAMLGDGDKAGELLALFDPIRHADTPAKLARYKVEPYVGCADVYSVAPHAGRGGWTWYSGSAGWLYRAIVEWVLGLRLHGDSLHVEPCIPRAWKGYSMTFRRGASTWRIEVENPHGVCRGVGSIEVDGVTLEDSQSSIALRNDGAQHAIRVTLQVPQG